MPAKRSKAVERGYLTLVMKQFFAALRKKLYVKVDQGVTGWDNDCPLSSLEDMLIHHVGKQFRAKEPGPAQELDIAALAMFIWWRRQHYTKTIKDVTVVNSPAGRVYSFPVAKGSIKVWKKLGKQISKCMDEAREHVKQEQEGPLIKTVDGVPVKPGSKVLLKNVLSHGAVLERLEKRAGVSYTPDKQFSGIKQNHNLQTYGRGKKAR